MKIQAYIIMLFLLGFQILITKWCYETMGKSAVTGTVIDKESPVRLGKYSHVERIVFFKSDAGKVYTLNNVEPYTYYKCYKGMRITFNIWKTEIIDFPWYKEMSFVLFLPVLFFLLLSVIWAISTFKTELNIQL